MLKDVGSAQKQKNFPSYKISSDVHFAMRADDSANDHSIFHASATDIFDSGKEVTRVHMGRCVCPSK